MSEKIYNSIVDQLRALVRGVELSDVQHIPCEIREEMENLSKHIFYCKFLQRIVTPAECAEHFKVMHGKNGIYNRIQCIEHYKDNTGHEEEIKKKAFAMAYRPLFMDIDEEVIGEWREDERQWQPSQLH